MLQARAGAPHKLRLVSYLAHYTVEWPAQGHSSQWRAHAYITRPATAQARGRWRRRPHRSAALAHPERIDALTTRKEANDGQASKQTATSGAASTNRKRQTSSSLFRCGRWPAAGKSFLQVELSEVRRPLQIVRPDLDGGLTWTLDQIKLRSSAALFSFPHSPIIL